MRVSSELKVVSSNPIQGIFYFYLYKQTFFIGVEINCWENTSIFLNNELFFFSLVIIFNNKVFLSE